MIREATGEAGDADAEEMFLYLGKFPDVESAFEKYNSTMDVMEYFEGCDYTDEDWVTLYNIIYAWSDMTCFGYIFNDACSSYLRGEIYYYFSQAYTNGDYTDYTAGGK